MIFLPTRDSVLVEIIMKYRVYAPLSGKVVPVTEIPDPVFADKIMGDGVGIDPFEGMVVSPVDGVITTVAKTKHAVSITTSYGLELLIHVGVETVTLEGRGFTPQVSVGERVTVGAPLLEFDSMELIMGGATSLISAILVTNSEKWRITDALSSGVATVGETELFSVESVGQDSVGEASVDCGTMEDSTLEETHPVETHRREVLVRNPQGLHARPAARLADRAKDFSSTITLSYQEKQGNLKSTISIMSVDVGPHALVTIVAEGVDSKEAVDTLVALIEEGLGEELLPLETTPEASVDSEVCGSVTCPPFKEDLSVEEEVTICADKSALLHGVSASQGFSVGHIYMYEKVSIPLQDSKGTPEEECSAIKDAIEQGMAELLELIKDADQREETEKKEIFEAHYTLLRDPEIQERVFSRIKSGVSAGRGWVESLKEFADMFRSLDNPLMAERAQDLQDIQDRVLALLYHIDTSIHLEHAAPIVLVAKDLTPSEFTQIVENPEVEISAILLAEGGPTAHVAILAASQGIPMVVALGKRVLALKKDIRTIVDSTKGEVFINPPAERYVLASRRVEKRKSSWPAMVEAAQFPITTEDGTPVVVAGNSSSRGSTLQAYELGADQIGLLRTEFVFMGQVTAPSEEVQYKRYQDIVDAMRGRLVIFRTLDVGGDKPMAYLHLPKEENPLMGVRGIRSCLSLGRELFRSQIRAILRVSPAASRKIMLPMITTLPELQEAKALIEEERKALGAEPISVGIMIEVPAAALIADILAKECDFFSIGTNDLTQYTMAMDRTNALLASKLNSLHPSVIRLIHMVVESAKEGGISTYMCGALASDPHAAPIVVGLGVSELSAVPPAIPEIKSVLSKITIERCKELAQEALKLHTSQEVQELIHREL